MSQRRLSGRNVDVNLACGHDAGLANLHRDGQAAWCPVCTADVSVRYNGRDPAIRINNPQVSESSHSWPGTGGSFAGGDDDKAPGRLEGHVNSAEYWLRQADIYEFPNPIRAECLQLAAIHASLAQALASGQDGRRQ